MSDKPASRSHMLEAGMNRMKDATYVLQYLAIKKLEFEERVRSVVSKEFLKKSLDETEV